MSELYLKEELRLILFHKKSRETQFYIKIKKLFFVKFNYFFTIFILF